MSIRIKETARKLIGGYRGTIQTEGYQAYDAYENAPGKRMIGCWAHARHKFVEAMDELSCRIDHSWERYWYGIYIYIPFLFVPVCIGWKIQY